MCHKTQNPCHNNPSSPSLKHSQTHKHKTKWRPFTLLEETLEHSQTHKTLKKAETFRLLEETLVDMKNTT